MNRIKLSGTDIEVSPVCIGCWQFNNGEQSADKTWPAQPIEVIHLSLYYALFKYHSCIYG